LLHRPGPGAHLAAHAVAAAPAGAGQSRPRRGPGDQLQAMKRLLLLAPAAGTAANAQRPTIDISNARVQAYPIALAPPSGAPEGADVMDVLAADFDRSGL